MQVLGRSKGEKVEIEGCALVRVAKIEHNRVRVDVTAPFSPVWKTEDEPSAARNADADLEANSSGIRKTSDADTASLLASAITIKIIGIDRHEKTNEWRAAIGFELPDGMVARRAEVVTQQKPAHEQFPWRRFRPTARLWGQIDETICIGLPTE